MSLPQRRSLCLCVVVMVVFLDCCFLLVVVVAAAAVEREMSSSFHRHYHDYFVQYQMVMMHFSLLLPFATMLLYPGRTSVTILVFAGIEWSP